METVIDGIVEMLEKVVNVSANQQQQLIELIKTITVVLVEHNERLKKLENK